MYLSTLSFLPHPDPKQIIPDPEPGKGSGYRFTKLHNGHYKLCSLGSVKKKSVHCTVQNDNIEPAVTTFQCSLLS